jgi:hypothetical protein
MLLSAMLNAVSSELGDGSELRERCSSSAEVDCARESNCAAEASEGSSLLCTLRGMSVGKCFVLCATGAKGSK